MTVFIKNSTFCKSSHNLIYVKIYINQIHPIPLSIYCVDLFSLL